MLFNLTTVQFSKVLRNLDHFFDKAAAHAEQKKFDVNTLLQARLAPDQFPFVRQVQTACDTAKLATARLTGKEAPSHPDEEKTVDELRARIRSVLNYLEGFTADDFAGAETRSITTPRWAGKTLSGADYAQHHAIPNFYFHVTTAYAILRHNGVDLGKLDFLGSLPFREDTRGA